MNRGGIGVIGAVIWLIGVLFSVSSSFGMNYAIALLGTWQNVSAVGVGLSGVGVLLIALCIDSLKKYFTGLADIPKFVGIIAALVTLMSGYLLATADPINVELGTGFISTVSLLSSLLISIFLILISIILFAGRHQMEVTTQLSTMSETALAGAMLSAIAGFVILIELVLPSNIGLFVLAPALILDTLVFLRLSYFE